MHSNVGQRLQDIDQALAHVIDARGEIGARVRALDSRRLVERRVSRCT